MTDLSIETGGTHSCLENCWDDFRKFLGKHVEVLGKPPYESSHISATSVNYLGGLLRILGKSKGEGPHPNQLTRFTK